MAAERPTADQLLAWLQDQGLAVMPWQREYLQRMLETEGGQLGGRGLHDAKRKVLQRAAMTVHWIDTAERVPATQAETEGMRSAALRELDRLHRAVAELDAHVRVAAQVD